MVNEKIVVVDDDLEGIEFIKSILEMEGYSVFMANDGVAGLEKVYSVKPDFLILDIDMPRMSGLEVCKKIREDNKFHLLPIILLTGSCPKPEDKAVGIDQGADDYLLKPFLPQELTARIKRLLARTKEQLSLNPLTKLPGSHLLELELTKRISNNEKIAVCYLDLDNFKAYNDYYGFARGNDVIQFVADVISNVVQEKGNPNDFLTHIGGDDFMLISSPEKIDDVCKFIIEKFSQEVVGFYNEEDRKLGFISIKNRKDEIKNFPLMSISLAAVTNEHRIIKNYLYLSDLLSEVKRHAKSISGNSFIKDRRKDIVADGVQWGASIDN